MKITKWWFLFAALASALIGSVAWNASGDREKPSPPEPQMEPTGPSDGSRRISMAQLLDLAADAYGHAVATVDDYSARFVQQERDDRGRLGDPTEMTMKVQTKHRGGTLGSPMRVYLKFSSPEAVAGREVIWAEDLRDGKLLVREAGMLGRVPIPPLDPTGMLAMRNQRYPIMEIGLTKLIEKLIQRGEQDREDESIRVDVDETHSFEGREVWLIRIERSQPANNENDFSRAEIIFDPTVKLVLRYRSFGWPEPADASPPLLESYTYHDLLLNVGLTDRDFDPANPDYDFPGY